MPQQPQKKPLEQKLQNEPPFKRLKSPSPEDRKRHAKNFAAFMKKAKA